MVLLVRDESGGEREEKKKGNGREGIGRKGRETEGGNGGKVPPLC